MAERLVLCYHAVSDSWQHPMSVRPCDLRAQLQHLLDEGYRPTTFSAALEAPAGDKVLAVTFDDGFRNTHETALPVLAALGIPATAFLPTSFVGRRGPLCWNGFDPEPLADDRDLDPMGWGQVEELVAAGWEIGSHSHTHPRLPATNGVRLLEELMVSRHECEQRLGLPCRSVAYPFGAVDARVWRTAVRAGYTAGAALGARTVRSPGLTARRVGVYRDDTMRRFRLKVSRPARLRTSQAALDVARTLKAGA